MRADGELYAVAACVVEGEHYAPGRALLHSEIPLLLVGDRILIYKSAGRRYRAHSHTRGCALRQQYAGGKWIVQNIHRRKAIDSGEHGGVLRVAKGAVAIAPF